MTKEKSITNIKVAIHATTFLTIFSFFVGFSFLYLAVLDRISNKLELEYYNTIVAIIYLIMGIVFWVMNIYYMEKRELLKYMNP